MSLAGITRVVALHAGLPNPCLGNADTARVLTRQIAQTFAFGDSARLVDQGLPARVSQIGLVKDAKVCARALEAWYAEEKNPSAPRASGAYVFDLDSAGYAVTPADDVNTLTYFDRTWRWLAAMVALD